MVVKRTEFYVRVEELLQHHIMLRVNGKSRRFDMQLALVDRFPKRHARTFDHIAEVMVPRPRRRRLRLRLVDDVELVDGGRITKEKIGDTG
jgi:hypothetical protein